MSRRRPKTIRLCSDQELRDPERKSRALKDHTEARKSGESRARTVLATLAIPKPDWLPGMPCRIHHPPSSHTKYEGTIDSIFKRSEEVFCNVKILGDSSGNSYEYHLGELLPSLSVENRRLQVEKLSKTVVTTPSPCRKSLLCLTFFSFALSFSAFFHITDSYPSVHTVRFDDKTTRVLNIPRAVVESRLKTHRLRGDERPNGSLFQAENPDNFSFFMQENHGTYLVQNQDCRDEPLPHDLTVSSEEFSEVEEVSDVNLK